MSKYLIKDKFFNFIFKCLGYYYLKLCLFYIYPNLIFTYEVQVSVYKFLESNQKCKLFVDTKSINVKNICTYVLTNK